METHARRQYIGLVYKLIHMGLPGELIKVTDCYLAHRAFRVRIDGAVSEWRPMLADSIQD